MQSVRDPIDDITDIAETHDGYVGVNKMEPVAAVYLFQREENAASFAENIEGFELVDSVGKLVKQSEASVAVVVHMKN